MRETKNNFCLACGACQGKDTQICVQKDDYAALLPTLDSCDAEVCRLDSIWVFTGGLQSNTGHFIPTDSK